MEPPSQPSPPPRPPNPFLGVHFVCGECYGRLYRNKEKTAYVGNCPRCGQHFKIAIGASGTSARMFQINCHK